MTAGSNVNNVDGHRFYTKIAPSSTGWLFGFLHTFLGFHELEVGQLSACVISLYPKTINAISTKLALHNKAAHEYAADATKSQTIDGD